ncbi:hypothetical protein N7466_006461 [Penicillium verhagenii]|uniref:uncharacterized protein n=1 Tax=Penicillium verhagenii TaxID=1562060 RepID=UPI002544DD04|nr:uncharacterized protein N7466_006461 [Penicillium verhagenii]KAJ5930968.1 hypothetical protein N7466_006461 [Penicillium verhagenii]
MAKPRVTKSLKKGHARSAAKGPKPTGKAAVAAPSASRSAPRSALPRPAVPAVPQQPKAAVTAPSASPSASRSAPRPALPRPAVPAVPAVPQQSSGPSLPIPPLPEWMEFDTVEEASTFANRHAKPYGFALVREKSCRDGGRYLTCRRGDKDYRRQAKGSAGHCPYEPIVRLDPGTLKWRIVFTKDVSRTHSHGQFTPRFAHSIHRQDELKRKADTIGLYFAAKMTYKAIVASLKSLDSESCVLERDLPAFKITWNAGRILAPRKKA